MNYPDLETCKAIGGEFEDSEFVWINNSAMDGTYYPPAIVKRNGGVWSEILAPAPTCEELGEWLHSKGFNLNMQWLGAGNWVILSPSKGYNGGTTIDRDLNETQARAEAVKLILEEK